jgi:hypothetical protein
MQEQLQTLSRSTKNKREETAKVTKEAREEDTKEEERRIQKRKRKKIWWWWRKTTYLLQFWQYRPLVMILYQTVHTLWISTQRRPCHRLKFPKIIGKM